MLSISEIFRSVQGEGPNRGQEVVFLRTAGCNLRCSWCDTPYALELRQGTKMSAEEVVKEVKSLDCQRLVLTGGEPMIQQAGLKEVLKALDGFFVEMETNGGFASEIDEYIDQYNCSPKLTGSGNKSYELKLLPNDKTWYKFVIDNDSDLKETLEFIEAYDLPAERVQLMPQGNTRALQEEKMPWLEKKSVEHGLHFTPRLHILNDFR